MADPDTYTLSWLAEENGALYTLEASLNLLPPWFAAGYVPAAEDPDLLEDELVELEVTTDAERMFFRVVRDNGIRIEAHCEEGVEGVVVTVDYSRFASQAGIDWTDAFIIERASEPEGPFDEVAKIWTAMTGSFYWVDYTVEQEGFYYYRVHFVYHADNDDHDSPPSNVAFIHVTCAAPGPTLTASCRPDRIVLRWEAPAWATPQNGINITDWQLMRSTDPEEESYESLDIGTSHTGQSNGLHRDTDVLPEIDYLYYVNFTYIDFNIFGSPSFTSPNSPRG